MNKTVSRHIQIDHWIFEVKMVRALRVKNYGEPYSAIANISFNGSSAYIDGMMQKDQQQLSNDDLQVLKEYCQQMSVKEIKIEPQNNLSTAQPLEQKITQLQSA